jgi:hypothetical protein
MLFHFEMSSNQVNRNAMHIFILSCPYGGTSTPIYKDNYRRGIGFFVARLMVDPRRKANWHLDSNVHIAPKKEK